MIQTPLTKKYQMLFENDCEEIISFLVTDSHSNYCIIIIIIIINSIKATIRHMSKGTVPT